MSLFHPLPSSMPIFARADLMVKRGECRDLSEAMRKLRSFRRPSRIDKPALVEPIEPIKPTPTGAQPEPRRCRLPYKDD